jgi:hypothetical protein
MTVILGTFKWLISNGLNKVSLTENIGSHKSNRYCKRPERPVHNSGGCNPSHIRESIYEQDWVITQPHYEQAFQAFNV